jgi:hypothetical protein
VGSYRREQILRRRRRGAILAKIALLLLRPVPVFDLRFGSLARCNCNGTIDVANRLGTRHQLPRLAPLTLLRAPPVVPRPLHARTHFREGRAHDRAADRGLDLHRRDLATP